jgi:hypothetical protein
MAIGRRLFLEVYTAFFYGYYGFGVYQTISFAKGVEACRCMEKNYGHSNGVIIIPILIYGLQCT